MSDLIDRQAAIDKINERQRKLVYCFGFENDLVKIMNIAKSIIIAIPSAQPEDVARDIATIIENEKDMRVMLSQQWIPCSERLPEDYEDVLVWFEYFRYGNYNCLYQMYGIGSYSSGYNSWLINQETGWNELKVFAWMPLPKPPKEEDE